MTTVIHRHSKWISQQLHNNQLYDAQMQSFCTLIQVTLTTKTNESHKRSEKCLLKKKLKPQIFHVSWHICDMFNRSIDLYDDMSYSFDRLIQSSIPENKFLWWKAFVEWLRLCVQAFVCSLFILYIVCSVLSLPLNVYKY